MVDAVALIFGCLYLLVGIVGFIMAPGGGMILGIFPVNLLLQREVVSRAEPYQKGYGILSRTPTKRSVKGTPYPWILYSTRAQRPNAI